MKKNKLSPRKQPRQDRSKTTVSAILQATTHILSDRGINNLSTNKIAQKAGVSIGSLYQYFPNRESIIEQLIEDYLDMEKKLIVDSILEVNVDDFSNQIRSIISNLYKIRKKNSYIFKIIRVELPQSKLLIKLQENREQLSLLLKNTYIKLKPQKNEVDLQFKMYMTVHAVDSMITAIIVDEIESSKVSMALEQICMITLKAYDEY